MRNISEVPTKTLQHELRRREETLRIHLCGTCYSLCGAGGCHGEGFNLPITHSLVSSILRQWELAHGKPFEVRR